MMSAEHSPSITRRTALGLGAIAAAAAATAGAIGGRPAAASAAAVMPRAGITGTVPSILASSSFPIVAYWPGHPYVTTAATYADIASAGFNTVLGNPYLMPASANVGAMEFASAQSIDYVAYDQFIGSYVEGPVQISSADATTAVNFVLTNYALYGTLGGLYIKDEVVPGEESYVAQFHSAARAKSPDALPYINLVPAEYSAFGPDANRAANYSAFVQNYIDTVQPTFLSADSYPLLYDGSDNTAAWYQTLSIIRDRGIANGLPYWGFIQAMGFGHVAASPSSGNRVPTAAELRWQANTLLVYGFKGIQYFCYWTPDPLRSGLSVTDSDRDSFFTGGLIATDGTKGPLWTAAQEFNPQLQHNGDLLLAQNSLYVQDASAAPDPGNIWTLFPDDFVGSSTRAPIWVGQFGGNAAQSSRYFFLVNQGHASSQSITITFNSGVTSVTDIGASVSGNSVTIGSSSGVITADITVGAGEAVLLRVVR